MSPYVTWKMKNYPVYPVKNLILQKLRKLTFSDFWKNILDQKLAQIGPKWPKISLYFSKLTHYLSSVFGFWLGHNSRRMFPQTASSSKNSSRVLLIDCLLPSITLSLGFHRSSLFIFLEKCCVHPVFFYFILQLPFHFSLISCTEKYLCRGTFRGHLLVQSTFYLLKVWKLFCFARIDYRMKFQSIIAHTVFAYIIIVQNKKL